MKLDREQVPVLVVDRPLEESRAGAVREAASHLAVGEERVEQPARVVDGRVVEHAHLAGRPLDLDDGDVDDEAVERRTRRRGRPRRAGRGSAPRSRPSPAARAPSRPGATRGSSARRRRSAAARRRRRCRRPAPCRRRARRPRRRTRAGGRQSCRALSATRSAARSTAEAHDAGEPRGVGAGGDRPGARRRVHVGQDLDLLGCDRRARRRRSGRTRCGDPGPAVSSRSGRVIASERGRPARCAPSALPDFGRLRARSSAGWASVM